MPVSVCRPLWERPLALLGSEAALRLATKCWMPISKLTSIPTWEVGDLPTYFGAALTKLDEPVAEQGFIDIEHFRYLVSCLASLLRDFC
jgi:hypothetical protein